MFVFLFLLFFSCVSLFLLFFRSFFLSFLLCICTTCVSAPPSAGIHGVTKSRFPIRRGLFALLKGCVRPAFKNGLQVVVSFFICSLVDYSSALYVVLCFFVCFVRSPVLSFMQYFCILCFFQSLFVSFFLSFFPYLFLSLSHSLSLSVSL